MLIDIHTHDKLEREGVFSVHVLDVAIDAAPMPDWKYFCAGLHPWNSLALNADELAAQAFSRLEELARLPCCLMIGETGLDRARGNSGKAWERQIEWTLRHMGLAQELGKPVALHCVRAYDLVLELAFRAGFKGALLFHDYNGDPPTTQRLLERADCYFSFGQSLFRSSSKGLRSLPSIPTHRLFLETDDSGRDIHEVLGHFPRAKEIDLEGNFRKLFSSVSIA